MKIEDNRVARPQVTIGSLSPGTLLECDGIGIGVRVHCGKMGDINLVELHTGEPHTIGFNTPVRVLTGRLIIE